MFYPIKKLLRTSMYSGYRQGLQSNRCKDAKQQCAAGIGKDCNAIVAKMQSIKDALYLLV